MIKQLKNKKLLLGIIGVLILLIAICGGYYCKYLKNTEKLQCSESATQNPTVERYTVTDLGNGWELYTDNEWHFSVEFPSSWELYGPTKRNESTSIVYTDYPYFVKYSKPNFTVGPTGASYEYTSKTENYIQKTIDGNKKFYAEIKSQDPTVLTEVKNIAPVETTIAGYPAKKIYTVTEFGEGVGYLIPNHDFSVLYDVFFEYKYETTIPEYQHMLDSFKILQ